MDEVKKPLKEQEKMFNKQEDDPERMLPSGHMSLMMKFLFLVVLNVVVFGSIYLIVKFFFAQSSDVAIMFSEIFTIVTLIGSVLFIMIKRK
ncbi:MAG: hypothetical protein WCW66_00755 [Patescibacteria group bacterium]